MPPIGLLLAGIDFSALKLILRDATPAVGTDGAAGFIAAKSEVAINYGKFINSAIKFVIVAWVLFLVIKAMNSMKRKQEAEPAAAPPEVPADVKLLTEIRDLLKAR
jgi:large conductance mechanosensitive channel